MRYVQKNADREDGYVREVHMQNVLGSVRVKFSNIIIQFLKSYNILGKICFITAILCLINYLLFHSCPKNLWEGYLGGFLRETPIYFAIIEIFSFISGILSIFVIKEKFKIYSILGLILLLPNYPTMILTFICGTVLCFMAILLFIAELLKKFLLI